VKLTTYIHLVPRLRMCGAISPLLQYVFMVWFIIEQDIHFVVWFLVEHKVTYLYFTLFAAFIRMCKFNSIMGNHIKF